MASLGHSELKRSLSGLLMLCFNTLRAKQNAKYFAGSISNVISWIKIVIILFYSYLYLFLIDNLELVQVMAWCQTGDKPSPEPMRTKYFEVIWGQEATMS